MASGMETERELSFGWTLLPPAVVALATGAFALVAAELAHISAWPLISYFDCAKVTLLCAVLFSLWIFTRAWLLKAEDPIGELRSALAGRLPLLLLPAVVLPAFLIGYTTSKTAIPLVVGYTWDGFWSDADRLIFRDDAWRIARAIFGNSTSAFWEYWYAVVWGCAFLLSTNLVTLFGSRRLVGTFFTALLGVWLIGGCLMAYAFSAAGPVFAPMFDPSLAPRFGPLQDVLGQTLGHRPIAMAQQYLLVAARETHVAVKGGGISAMPSMHLATVSIYVLAARGTKWLLPAIAFWILIFIGSGYFGFHYWVDGLVAAVLSFGCWLAAAAIYARLSQPAGLKVGELEPAVG
ncbi:MAG TPA: phosphatase PAP2 family protein [Sphingomicrobium sp.]|nr:phosphatase PAP2 family protein [Sphingomicrobium sp.]